MDKNRLRKQFYSVSFEYLIKQLPEARAMEIMAEHLDLEDASQTHVTLNKLYEGLLISAQNVQGKPNQIGRAIGGIGQLARITNDFDPSWVVEHYRSSDEIFEQVLAVLKPSGRVNREPRGVWPKYCRTMFTAARFFSQFESGQDFYICANRLYSDIRSQDALPLWIAHHVDGVQYALACDFLKEKGFLDYGKPDVHVKDILKYVGLCAHNASEHEFQAEIRAIAKAIGKTAYHVDKLIWLLGSGNFYMSEDGPVLGGRPKIDFYKFWDSILPLQDVRLTSFEQSLMQVPETA